MNPKSIFTLLVILFCFTINLPAQIEGYKFPELPTFENYKDELPSFSNTPKLQLDDFPQSPSFEMRSSYLDWELLEGATVVENGLLLSNGTILFIKIATPNVEGMAPMPIAGKEQIPDIEPYQFKDWSKE